MLITNFASEFVIEGSGELPEFQDRNFDQILSRNGINENIVGKAVDRSKTVQRYALT